MNLLNSISIEFFSILKDIFDLSEVLAEKIHLNLKTDGNVNFGDLSSNAAMILAKELGQPPLVLVEKIKKALLESSSKALSSHIDSVEVAKPGFLNIKLHLGSWQQVIIEILQSNGSYWSDEDSVGSKKYLIEFVSANPTGPLHLGHGRGGIIGDVLAKVLSFQGHKVEKEFYVNDAGVQIEKLGESLRARCLQELGQDVQVPEGGYQGEYLIEVAKEFNAQNAGIAAAVDQIKTIDKILFADFAKNKMLELAKNTLADYGIVFDRWFSEKSLYNSGSVSKAVDHLTEKGLTCQDGGATWFKATKFGEEKDCVLKKSDGSFTYLAPDIAYHEDKFARGYDVLINILGQDHHGYSKRLKATMEAIEFPADGLQIILYQLVQIKQGEESVRMSKRKGTFETLSDIIDAVGTDVARFFYLNRKASAHLVFDLSTALKKTEENPVYYIQYAFVRTKSIEEKAQAISELADFLDSVNALEAAEGFDGKSFFVGSMSQCDIDVVKKACSLKDILKLIEKTYQTHLLSYYAIELAKLFHNYYAKNRVVDPDNLEVSKIRLVIVRLVQKTLHICLDLLGLDKPEKM
jgi:arginyl-tRNA synthetase